MQFTRHDLGHLDAGDVVIVTLSGTEANVVLVDPSGLQAYSSGQRFTHYGGGGHFRSSPARLTVPHAGHWYVCVDLGGAGGSVRSGVTVLSRAA
jgi:hypothetical protein